MRKIFFIVEMKGHRPAISRRRMNAMEDLCRLRGINTTRDEIEDVVLDAQAREQVRLYQQPFHVCGIVSTNYDALIEAVYR